MTRRDFLGGALSLLTILLLGCAAVDRNAARRDHVAAFLPTAEEKAGALLAEPLALEDCVRIALENNLDVRTAEIESRLATLDRKIAFGALLPHLEFEFARHGTRDPVLFNFAGGTVQMADRQVTEAAISAQLPIFMPQAWLLHRMRREGEEIRALIETRVRQLVTLRVTALYYTCRAREAMRAPAGSSLRQAGRLHEETRALRDEGLVTEAALLRAKTLVTAREQDVADNERAEAVARAELLEAMGLSPIADLRLSASEDRDAPETDLSVLVLEALLRRPDLHVADGHVRIHEDALLVAIAEFLPKIVGFGGLTNTSDSYLASSHMTALGISGVVSLFDGFRNVAEYHAAEEREAAARLDRERACLAVMLEVVRAHRAVTEARAHSALARDHLDASRRGLEEVESRFEEGVALTSERLEARATLDRARANAALIRIREQVAIATLHDVVGRPGVAR